MKKKQSKSFYIKGKKRRDEELHDSMLADGDKKWEGSAVQKASIEYAITVLGLTKEEAIKAYSR